MLRSLIPLRSCIPLLAAAFAATADAVPVVQPDTLPGRIAITVQPLPPLAGIVAAPLQARPIYGLYVWASEFRMLREQIRAVGWKQIRFSGPWDDATMRMVVEDDIEVMMTLGSRLKRTDYPSDEAFIAEFTKRITDFLTRYGPGGTFFKENPALPVRPIQAVEIFNEPNFQYVIPDREPRAEVEAEREALYAKILPAAYAVIKATWPSVNVVGFSAGGAAFADVRFIANVWKLQPAIGGSCDILSTHPYVQPAPPEADSVRTWGSYSVAKGFAAIRGTVGQTLPIWYTELGWPVSKADGGHFDMKTNDQQVTPLLQAAYVCRQYALALRLGVGRVHVMFATDTDNFNGGFFLRDSTWRPSARAVATMITAMPFPKLRDVPNDGVDGWYAWTFAGDARQAKPTGVTMAFAVAGPRQVTLPWSAPAATVTDLLGAVRTVDAKPATGGGWTLPLDIGPCPVYVQAKP